MQRGMILTISEVVIVIMIFESATLIHENGGRYLLELKVVEKVKDFEMLSYNIMFDLCLNMRHWVSNADEPLEKEHIEYKLAGWMRNVREILQSEGEVELVVEDLQITRYEGQPCDAVQMAFIGRQDMPSKYISGTLFVSFDWLFVKTNREFKIRMAV